MGKLLKSNFGFLGLIAVLVIPTFWRLLRPGIFSMQDMHIFRLFDFEKCILDLQIPCRWSPDAAFGYGQPVFNFYGQLSYLFGEFFRLLHFSFIDSLKGVFIASLIISAFGMFLLGKQIWGSRSAGLISAMVYTYAPYRAVDIWVRGALPEATSFMFFPFITYFFNDYVKRKRPTSLLFFGLLFSVLMLNHNLSTFMYLFFLLPWGVYYISKEKSWHLWPFFFGIGVLILSLVSFYLIPLVAESSFVSLQKTISGYFDFHNHFVTLKELLVSRYWGYGASLWGDDDRLSLSVGHVQWILPLIITVLLVFRRSWRKYGKFFVLLGLGWLMLLLTHNKSTPFWNIFLPMAYVQFPWRFLGMAVFSFALASGLIVELFKNFLSKFTICAVTIAALVALNTPFFFEDLWFYIGDNEQFSGARYEQLEGLGVTDYWPITSKVFPSHHAPDNPTLSQGTGSGLLIQKTSNMASYSLAIKSQSAIIEVPIVYFPGWKAYDGSTRLDLYPSGDLGLMTTRIDQGDHKLDLKFTDTFVRGLGNTISLISFGVLFAIFIGLKIRKR